MARPHFRKAVERRKGGLERAPRGEGQDDSRLRGHEGLELAQRLGVAGGGQPSAIEVGNQVQGQLHQEDPLHAKRPPLTSVGQLKMIAESESLGAEAQRFTVISKGTVTVSSWPGAVWKFVTAICRATW
jgi:hypothetical protein